MSTPEEQHPKQDPKAVAGGCIILVVLGVLLVLLVVFVLDGAITPSRYDIGMLSCRGLANLAEKRLSDLSHVSASGVQHKLEKRLVCLGTAKIDGSRERVILHIFENSDGSQKLGYRQ